MAEQSKDLSPRHNVQIGCFFFFLGLIPVAAGILVIRDAVIWYDAVETEGQIVESQPDVRDPLVVYRYSPCQGAPIDVRRQLRRRHNRPLLIGQGLWIEYKQSMPSEHRLISTRGGTRAGPIGKVIVGTVLIGLFAAPLYFGLRRAIFGLRGGHGEPTANRADTLARKEKR